MRKKIIMILFVVIPAIMNIIIGLATNNQYSIYNILLGSVMVMLLFAIILIRSIKRK